jgi:hypothetical protein
MNNQEALSSAKRGPKPASPTNDTPRQIRESLYGIYLNCSRGRKLTQGDVGRNEATDDFADLVNEITYDLTEVERRRLLKMADGLSTSEIAHEERCKREAVLCSVRNMIRKNEYCRISARYGVLRRRINQHK